MIQMQKQALVSNEETDAICKRTRARCSLASSTLDDLEAFLHETDDDEDDISNIDDNDEEAEEYRKFLAGAVSHNGEVQVSDDDDEDKDADFEMQLEQSLETNVDETSIRPVTRRKRRANITNDSRSLRPLVPILPITQQPVTRFYGFFSQSQIRELHCLIHDHIQLLIQVYSLCAFDHSKQHIGTQVQGLITEMVLKQQRPSSHLLDLAARYLADVSGAVQDYRKRQVESGFNSMFERVPLFESGGHKDPGCGGVPKDISELAKVFLPLFKVSLFPSKPPGGGKRSLFTGAEDELLALGIMEYNSDWKAIKQRFLPCKSEHQIFIRKKNKGASRASDNPIKAVLRMKSSSHDASKANKVYLHEGFLAEERPSPFYYATSMHSYENDRLESCTQRLAPCVFPHKKSVVRLASDLPPVSLPSSASVIISPSVFAKKQCSKTSISKGGMSRREKLSSTEKVNSSEKNDSGLVMHPLLFRTFEHGQIYTGGSCSSSFLSEIRPQLLSLFNNTPRKIDHSAALGDSCFHPLLRRSENLDTSSGNKTKLCQLEDTSGAVDKACIADSQAPGSTATSRCIDEMADQSNLGIVMEHEELSDSDQEMMEEENVEFECEEMTDSQGEDDSECDGNSR